MIKSSDNQMLCSASVANKIQMWNSICQEPRNLLRFHGSTEIKTKWWLLIWRVAVAFPQDAVPWAAADWKVSSSIGMELLEIRRRSESITQAMKKSRRRRHMIVPTIIARHHVQSVACSSSRKFWETDATSSRKKCRHGSYHRLQQAHSKRPLIVLVWTF